MDLQASPLIRLTSLSFRYPRQATALFEDASFSIFPGTVTALVGPNGAGKSTLLDILAGAAVPSSGTIASRLETGEVGYVPQNPVAFGNLRYEETVELIRALGGAADATLAGFKEGVAPRWRADLERLRRRFLGELSGGERQWLYLLLTLAAPRVRLWLLDEPLTALDDDHKAALRDLLAAGKRAGKAALVAVHDLAEFEGLWDGRVRIEGRRIGSETHHTPTAIGRPLQAKSA